VDPDHELLLERNLDEDTRVLKTAFIRVAGVPILIESWAWEGYGGSTAVLLTRDAGPMSDEALKLFLTAQAHLNLAGSVTISRREVHTYVNFGFQEM